VTEKIALPDGGWALLRDPQNITERQRRPLNRLQARVAGSAVGALIAHKATMTDVEFEEESRKILGSEDFALLDELNDALIGVLVDSWSYDSEPSADAALDLPGPVYEALKNECAKHVTALAPQFTPVDAENPESPTAPSAG
jgi:hypothetical protein